MTAASKIRADGLVAVPPDLARDIGAEPGVTVTFRAVGPHTVEMTVWPLVPDDVVVRRRSSVDKAAGEVEEIIAGAGARGGVEDFRPLTLAEMIERFSIEGPIDEVDLREGWHEEAAKDVIGE